jgi:hypothetical protein
MARAMDARLTHTVVTAASIRMLKYRRVGLGLDLVAAVLAPEVVVETAAAFQVAKAACCGPHSS